MKLFLTITILLCSYGNAHSAFPRMIKVDDIGKQVPSGSKLQIINGVPATIAQFPYQAGLVIPNIIPEYISVCGGSLITNKTVLTAAHCLESITATNATKINVTLNSIDFFGRTEGSIIVKASGIFVHPNYGGPLTLWDNDIALVYLQTPVTTVTPVKLACPSSNYTGATAAASGWGDTSPGQDVLSFSQLMMTNLTIFDHDNCGTQQPPMNDRQVCAGALGTDICRGDSGGPLTVRGRQVGITSYGYINCNFYPNMSSVFTQVSSFRNWIDTHKQ